MSSHIIFHRRTRSTFVSMELESTIQQEEFGWHIEDVLIQSKKIKGNLKPEAKILDFVKS